MGKEGRRTDLRHALGSLGVRAARRLLVDGLARDGREELPELGRQRVLDLVGCTIPLTSPIIFSPHLTCLIINIARGCEARQVHEMLQAAPQLQTTHLKFPDNLVSPESASFLPKVHPRHLRELFLAGVSVSVLAVLEQFRFTLTQVKILLFVSVLPTPGNPREVGRRLFEVLGTS